MLRRQGGGRGALTQLLGPSAGLLIAGGSVAVAILLAEDRVSSLSVILGVAAVLAGALIEGGEERAANVSGSFIVIGLAAALCGPASAGLVAAITELCAAARFHNSPRVVLAANLPGCIVPAVAEGLIIHALAWPPSNTPTMR
jgi:hypothetical protein